MCIEQVRGDDTDTHKSVVLKVRWTPWAWPLHDFATTNMVCGMAEQGGRGKTIYCAILIATYSGGGVRERRCGMPRIVLTSAQSPNHQTNIL